MLDSHPPHSAVVLCGGRGSRLRPLTDELPKPLVPVLGKPLLEYVVEALRPHGFGNFVFATGYRSQQIESFVGDLSSRLPDTMRCVDSGVDAPIAERLHSVLPLLPADDDFLLVNGDAIFDLDVTALRFHHLATGAVATVASVEVPSPYGLVVEQEGRVVDFTRSSPIRRVESSAPKHPVGYVHSGIAWLSRSIFDHFDPATCENFEQEVYGQLAAEGKLGHKHLSGSWRCVDTQADLERAEDALCGAAGALR